MDQIKKTTYKLAFLYTGIFILLFFVVGAWFFSSKYFSKNNTQIWEIQVITFESTWEWDEIDVIFKFLEDSTQKEIVEKKQYSLEEYQSDLKFFSVFLLIGSIFFFILSLKLVIKTIRPVAENMDDMRHFIDDAGHELKTPLAAIDSSMQLMSATQKFDPILLEKSQKEILRTNKLIETLRDLSNITEVSKKKIFSIEASIQKVVENYSKVIADKGLIVEYSSREDFTIKANISYFEIVFSNLLSNAIKYNRQWKKIIIWYSNNIVSVQDEWEGIADEKKRKVFNRFYRMKHHRKQEWFWLWLALVQRICQMYKWDISVESIEKKGSTFSIKF